MRGIRRLSWNPPLSLYIYFLLFCLILLNPQQYNTRTFDCFLLWLLFNDMYLFICYYPAVGRGFQNRPTLWSMLVIRGDQMAWGSQVGDPLHVFLFVLFLLSVLFFILYVRINCLGWGRGLRPLCASVPFLFFYLLTCLSLASTRVDPAVSEFRVIV